MSGFVLTLACPDRVGIVYAVTGFLAERGGNIVDSQQFGDRDNGRFFMRVHFECGDPDATRASLQVEFAPVAAALDMTWDLRELAVPGRLLVMVSRLGHCLNDLLYRHRIGALAADLAVVVSNHDDFADLVGAYGIPFAHVPVEAAAKAQAEARLLDLVGEHQIDVVVLARYMQVLSDDLCHKMSGRIINIHHSFLPSFKGARPYHQAHTRGVKLIGATAHYATADLDEGPIIEQEVARIDHRHSPVDMAAIGRDLECVALARALQYHLEHRVLLNGNRTVVFR